MGAVRAGVVGLGYFGSFHAKHYAANPEVALVGVVDADPGRAQAVAERVGAAPLTDHRDLIGKVEAVSIAVPTSLHHAVARDFIEAGIHVLVEKPVTHDPDSARDLIARARKAGVVLQVGHIERFSPVFAALEADIGEPLMLDFVRAAPWTGRAADVDVVLDLMIHDVDLALALARSPVADVAASGASITSGVTDSAEARISFENGLVATLRASRVAHRLERRVTIHEADRVLAADMAERKLAVYRRAIGGGMEPVETIDVAPRDALGAEIGAFVGSVSAGWPVRVDGQAGLDALLVLDRIRSEIARSAGGRRPSREN